MYAYICVFTFLLDQCERRGQSRGETGITGNENRGRTRPKDPRLRCAFPLSAHAPRTRALRHFLRATE